MGTGLFVNELVRNRRLSLELQATLRGLVETSPAAIVTVDEHGSIELATGPLPELKQSRHMLELLLNPGGVYVSALHHAGCAAGEAVAVQGVHAMPRAPRRRRNFHGRGLVFHI